MNLKRKKLKFCILTNLRNKIKILNKWFKIELALVWQYWVYQLTYKENLKTQANGIDSLRTWTMKDSWWQCSKKAFCMWSLVVLKFSCIAVDWQQWIWINQIPVYICCLISYFPCWQKKKLWFFSNFSQ